MKVSPQPMRARTCGHPLLASWVLAASVAVSASASAGATGKTLPAAPGSSIGQPALPTLAPMLARVLPGVVGVTIVQDRERTNPLLADPSFRQYFEQSVKGKLARSAPSEPRPAGSGVIIDSARGLVLTNHHVIQNASRIVVVLSDRRELAARLLGSDDGTDIALLQVAAANLVAIPMADAAPPAVGDFVVAIGNPFGLGETVTLGIVSALGRSGLSPEGYEDYIQTDAAINPGNSGGALINLRGQLIGINTAILTGGPGNRGNIGIGFAVPVGMAREVATQIERFGSVRRGRIGVNAIDLTPRLAEERGIALREGALISSVEADSPAAQAGIRPDDIVVRIEQGAVRSSGELRNRLALMPVGSTAQLTIVRGRGHLTIPVTVVAATAGEPASPAPVTPADLAGNWGLQVVPADGQTLSVVAVEPGRRAYASGLRPGDVIVALNREPMSSAEHLAYALASPGEKTLSVLRADSKLHFEIR